MGRKSSATTSAGGERGCSVLVSSLSSDSIAALTVGVISRADSPCNDVLLSDRVADRQLSYRDAHKIQF